MKRFISFLIRFIPRKYLQLFSGVGLKVVGVFYKGDTVQCPICEKGYRQFLPYGRINPRPNALCPNCLSLERHRLIWLYLKEQTNFFSKKLDVLHIAPEPCFMKRFEKQHGKKYITADIESPLAKVKMDIHQIPFPDNHFDAVLCNHVLEHVADDIKAMSEIHRVLKPGGWAIMQVPFFSPIPETTYEDTSITNPRDREKAFGQDDHVRMFGKDYAQRIARAGLKPEENEFAKTQPDRYGISKNEIIYIGKKI
ncbi:MAG: methyltransferase domain-containing protein [Cyclobacteriaceae bacterium]|nr:methyltransferase domain-containing protein [Cyclobacteriaceae bacterium]